MRSSAHTLRILDCAYALVSQANDTDISSATICFHDILQICLGIDTLNR